MLPYRYLNNTHCVKSTFSVFQAVIIVLTINSKAYKVYFSLVLAFHIVLTINPKAYKGCLKCPVYVQILRFAYQFFIFVHCKWPVKYLSINSLKSACSQIYIFINTAYGLIFQSFYLNSYNKK